MSRVSQYGQRGQIVAWLARYRGLEFHLYDYLSLGFASLVGGLSLAFSSAAERPGLALLHLAYAILGLELVRLSQRVSMNSWLFALRLGYGAFVLVVSFMQVGRLQALLHGGYWFTEPLVGFEHWLFGVHPPLWVQQWYQPWLNELMSFFHLAYYFMPFIMAVPLMRQGRRAELLAAMAQGMMVYVATYTVFIGLPAMNPRTSPELGPAYTAPAAGYLFFALEHALQGDTGTVAGNCFPSAHASGATIWALLTVRLQGLRAKASVVNLVLAAGTTAATVYLGFHHALDPISGVLLAIFVYFLGTRKLTEATLGHKAASSAAQPREPLGRNIVTKPTFDEYG